MNDTTQTLVRSILKLLAGALVARGYTDDTHGEMIVGGGLAVIGILWGVVHRRTPTSSSTAIPPFKITLWFLAASLAAGVLVGCAQTPARIAYNTVKVPEVTVDQAMTVWGDYVRANHPPAAIEAQVKAAYLKYQAAELLAIDAARAAAAAAGSTNIVSASIRSQQTSQNAQEALADLVNLLRTLGLKI